MLTQPPAWAAGQLMRTLQPGVGQRGLSIFWQRSPHCRRRPPPRAPCFGCSCGCRRTPCRECRRRRSLWLATKVLLRCCGVSSATYVEQAAHLPRTQGIWRFAAPPRQNPAHTHRGRAALSPRLEQSGNVVGYTGRGASRYPRRARRGVSSMMTMAFSGRIVETPVRHLRAR